jgi:hypothetical protein
MANYYEATTNISAKKFVTFSSRYSASNVVYYTEKKLLTFNTYKKKKPLSSPKDRFMSVTANLEYRPDLVSQMAYGTCDFWWKIMEANGIKDIFDFKTGLNLRIPDSVLF